MCGTCFQQNEPKKEHKNGRPIQTINQPIADGTRVLLIKGCAHRSISYLCRVRTIFPRSFEFSRLMGRNGLPSGKLT